MDNYLNLANSNILFLICLVPIICVIIQSIVYIRIAIKQSKELKMDQQLIKKVITNSAVFSILPSLPIVITMAALMPVLGKFVPWLRLSVIGSATYESMCADMTITSFGFNGLGDASITTSVFVGVVYVMSLVALCWPLCNVVGLRFYDGAIKKAGSGSKSGFMPVAVGALFIGLMSVMGIPKFLNFSSPTCIIVSIVSGVSVLLLDFISKKSGLKALSEFSFPLAMILGMISAIIVG